MIYGYARVSTKCQAKDGNSLEQQEKVLRENGATEVIKEQFTGTTTKRPKFDELIEILKDGDTLIVTKLDRFARTTTDGLNIINKLLKKNIKVNILNMGIMDNSPASELIRTMFLAFAQFERDMIVERTQEGKAIAKQKPGFKEGRPKAYTKKQLDHALNMLSVNGGNCSYTEVVEITKISKSTLIREVKLRKAEELKIRNDAIAKAKELKKQGGVGQTSTKLSYRSDDALAKVQKQSKELKRLL